MVDVVMITYGHEKFIQEAIEGVLMQQTSFPFRLLISEDYGPDDTRRIVNEYLEANPEKILLLDFKTNLGISRNFFSTIETAKAPYVALCEGDDYWIDPHKLQEQVEFLEANTDCIAIADNATVLHDNGTKTIFSNQTDRFITTFDLLRKRQLATAGFMFRNQSLPKELHQLIFADTPLFIHLSTKGKIYFRNKITSVYRLGAQGVTSDVGKNKAKSLEIIEMNKYLNSITQCNYSKAIDYQIAKHYWMIARIETRFTDKLKWSWLSLITNPKYLFERLLKRN